jgi:hypothetical protein
MYFRTKRSGGLEYLQVVESHRVDGKPRQSVVATLGRRDVLNQSGELDRLIRSGARFTESAMLLSAVETGEATTIEARRIGPPLLFERLWRDSFCRAVIEDLLADRKFAFPVERAIFLTVLHRIWARTAPRRSGGPPIALAAWTRSTCITSTGRWPGSARNWRIKPAAA